ncbi:hypothetical protein [Alicyclobacillus fodiniaquatilis]|uniref:Uncharacterized protein n=1 Tax=Alicyclobacillus fodiniaquatilis TaxID=1661150 RepID=A0ABW4JGD3_9BACL
MAAKRKQMPPRRKRMNRAARLQFAKSWLPIYTRNHLIRSYRKRFGVDLTCAITELGILGVQLDDTHVKQLYQSEQARLNVRQRTKLKRQCALETNLWPDSDDHHSVIIGYTSGGMPYGLAWDEVNDWDVEE